MSGPQTWSAARSNKRTPDGDHADDIVSIPKKTRKLHHAINPESDTVTPNLPRIEAKPKPQTRAVSKPKKSQAPRFQQERPFRFKDLPAELRNAVYEYALEVDQPLRPTIERGGDGFEPDRFPDRFNILLADKQLYHEAKHIFEKQCKLDIWYDHIEGPTIDLVRILQAATRFTHVTCRYEYNDMYLGSPIVVDKVIFTHESIYRLWHLKTLFERIYNNDGCTFTGKNWRFHIVVGNVWSNLLWLCPITGETPEDMRHTQCMVDCVNTAIHHGWTAKVVVEYATLLDQIAKECRRIEAPMNDLVLQLEGPTML